MDIRVINNFYNKLIDINLNNYNELNIIKNNNFRPIDSMFLKSIEEVNLSLNNLISEINVSTSNDKIKIALKNFIRSVTKLLNDDLVNILKHIYEEKELKKITSELKKIREHYIDMIENKIKHNQNDINIFKKTNNKITIYGFFLEEVSSFKNFEQSKYHIIPNPIIHKKYKGVYTGFSINRYLKQCIYIIVNTIQKIHFKVLTKFPSENNSIKSIPFVNTINNLKLGNDYFIDEYETTKLYNINNFFIQEDTLSKYKKMSGFKYEVNVELGTEIAIPYLKNDKKFLL